MPQLPLKKSSGITESERYLERVCQRNFLSFWSYPRPFRDQGGNKEICDLLVIMGNDVIVFSDKHCVLAPRSTLEIDWQRWFRSAVKSGAMQAWGAERWLRDHSQRVFLDPECTQPLPVQVPPPDVARYHLVVTVHGISEACRRMLGGTGSLMMRTGLRGLTAHVEPFVIGDLDPDRSFIHVFDDATLDFVMSTLDTTTDFLRYLREKERVCRSTNLFVAGEENLLAHYLTHVDADGEHALIFDSSADFIGIDESWWDHFAASEERRAQLEHDRVSYFWDQLIERFAQHAFEGTQYYVSEPPLQSSETVLRFMAAESRLRRRSLAEALLDAVETTDANQRRLRVLPSQLPGEPMYVFLLCPWRDDATEHENRAFRRNYLEACVFVAKMKNKDALDIIGIATESGTGRVERTEDALYFDSRSWSIEDEELAQKYQSELEILVAEQTFSTPVLEYPVIRPPSNPRNKPCPCGSGRKYKHCHGS